MDKRIEGFFLILSASLVWLANPPALIGGILKLIGIDRNSASGMMTEGLAIGVFLLFFQRAAILIFDRLVLPFYPSYVGGTWVYALLPKPNVEFSDDRPTVGRFRIRLRAGRYVVEDGYAYWVKSDELIGRGQWSSSIMCASESRIDMIYQLDAEFRFEGEKATHYEGHIKLRPCKERKVIGRPYRGHFNDLEERAHVRGPIYAERVNRFQWRIERLRSHLEQNKTKLLGKLNTDQ